MKKAMLFLALAMAAATGALADTIRLPLQQLTPLASFELRCVSDQKEIQVPLPERWELRRLVLHLRYTVSTNLIPDSSQLVIRMRGQPVAQARLNPMAPDVKLGVEIPVKLLQPGYNALAFQVAQHFSKNQCESPCSPDLWTNVSLAESYLEMEYDWKPVPTELSSLSAFVFDPRLMPAGEVHIVTEDDSATSATLAGIVASGIARRFDFRRVGFTVSRAPRAGVDNVLVGKRAFAAKTLGEAAVRPAKGGYLKVLPMRGAAGEPDPTRAMLVVTGESDIAVKIAAITFANISFKFPGSDELEAFEFKLPEVEQYSGRETIRTDQTYSLKTLNFPTQSFVGINPGSRGITFRLPPDFHIRPNQYAKLALNFSYGAGLKSDSSFNIAVNGKGVRAVALDSASGNFIDGYKLDIPTYVFQPGTNTISFTGHLHAGGQVCDLIQPDNLFLTIYENSTITFPPMPHFVEMPKLELFMHSGFPLTRWPDGHEAYVWLTEKNDRVLAAALNLLGVATQRNGFPLFEMEFTYERPAKEGEIFVVGRVPTVPKELWQAAPLKLLDDGVVVPYPVVRGWNTEFVESATSRQKSALGPGRGLLMQFQSPWHPGRTVTMLTGVRAEDIGEASQALITSLAQGQTKGDLVLIEPGDPEPKVTAMVAGSPYATGKKGSYSPLESFLYTRPWAYYAVSAAALVVLAVALFFGLRRWRRSRRAKG
ncbi:MAG: cellulose biosynthesis cyclic di-GMP-binding regulatory protein BcsB [Betaproteobacteria bacterium]|nr:cellulose biosynthesis cyclic di-GMP-binding regulatory protein BcsB [Betaproteobacteria bacterium]PWB63812.1 MAG: cellulose synthase [Betaproteobacteria bacterium]